VARKSDMGTGSPLRYMLPITFAVMIMTTLIFFEIWLTLLSISNTLASSIPECASVPEISGAGRAEEYMAISESPETYRAKMTPKIAREDYAPVFYVEREADPVIADTPSTPEIDPVAAALAQTMWAEARGLPDDERSAVAWCVLNRVDSDMYPDTVMENLTAPAQFAYWPDAPVTDDLYALALDVLSRWERERAGETDVGRTLPPEYLYFEGDGRHNYFSTAWRGGEYWSFGGER